MQVRRAYRAWRRATIAAGLFVLSLLAPTVWREVRIDLDHETASGDMVEWSQGERELPCPPRMDAYVPPTLPGEAEPAGMLGVADVVRDGFASRCGQLYSPRGAAGDSSDGSLI